MSSLILVSVIFINKTLYKNKLSKLVYIDWPCLLSTTRVLDWFCFSQWIHKCQQSTRLIPITKRETSKDFRGDFRKTVAIFLKWQDCSVAIWLVIPLQLFKSYCAECDKFYKNHLSHGKNISWNVRQKKWIKTLSYSCIKNKFLISYLQH